MQCNLGPGRQTSKGKTSVLDLRPETSRCATNQKPDLRFDCIRIARLLVRAH